MVTLGKFTRVPLREVWAHEASDFTQWLALPSNLQELSDAIGIELYDAQTEVSVGRFFVDILAEDETGRKIIIENQLEPTNHDHLGKTITYAAGLGAQVIVWIVQSAREEHEEAVNWLNENTGQSVHFFLLQIEAWRIGDSLPAPRFNIIAKPNDWAKDVKQIAAATQTSSLALKQQAFYELVRDYGLTHAPHVARCAESFTAALVRHRDRNLSSPPGNDGQLCKEAGCSRALHQQQQRTIRPSVCTQA